MTTMKYARPFNVAAEQACVLIDGEGVALTMTPAAAAETADRLKAAADTAQMQVADGDQQARGGD